MSLEEAWLRACLRARWEPGALDEATALAAQHPLNWETVESLATRRNVAPLLYEIIRGAHLLPHSIEAQLRLAYYQNARRNVLLFRELETVLKALGAAQLPVIVLKGAALAHTVYKNPAVRPMCDLDLLVKKADMPAALRCCEALGYQAGDKEAHPGDTLAYENELLLRKPGALEAVLELHWSLFDSPYYQSRLPMNWFWETTQPITFENLSTQTLGVEAQVLHLCGHLALHHGPGGLANWLWLYDIAALITNKQQLNWDLLLSRAQTLNLVLSLQYVLEAIADLLNPPYLKTHLVEVQRLQPSAEEARVFSWLTAEHRPVLQRFVADLASIPGWPARLAYAWHSIFPSTSYMRSRYHIAHGILLPLYYPYRWWLGIWGMAHKS